MLETDLPRVWIAGAEIEQCGIMADEEVRLLFGMFIHLLVPENILTEFVGTFTMNDIEKVKLLLGV